MKIGAVLVPINTRLRTEDVAYIADQSDSTALILAERSGPIDYLAMVRELVPPGVAPAATRLPKLRHIVLFGDEPRPDTVAWSAVLAGGAAVDDAALAARADAVDPEDLAFLMYTSGTTGFPRARCTAIA
jgi:fatty-acyl-CoA synthase